MTHRFYKLSPEKQAARLEQLAREALLDWGLGKKTDLTLIKHRENAVFKAIDPDGNCYAVRVHRHGYHSDRGLRSELQWMIHLNEKGIRTPLPIPALDGELFKTIPTRRVPEPRQCDLISWVEGEPLGSIEEGVSGGKAALEEAYRSIGVIAGTIHNVTAEWKRPTGFERQAWDENGTLGDDPLWGRFWDLKQLKSPQRKLLLAARDQALEQLARFGKDDDRYGLIHGDLLPENLLQAPGGLCLIDFDDSGFGWHLFEFATSLFFHLGEPHFDTVCDAMVEGYRSVRKLPDEHLALLPTFFLIRGLVYLGWAHTRSETETAKEMTPMMIEAVTALANEFLVTA